MTENGRQNGRTLSVSHCKYAALAPAASHSRRVCQQLLFLRQSDDLICEMSSSECPHAGSTATVARVRPRRKRNLFRHCLPFSCRVGSSNFILRSGPPRESVYQCELQRPVPGALLLPDSRNASVQLYSILSLLLSVTAQKQKARVSACSGHLEKVAAADVLASVR